MKSMKRQFRESPAWETPAELLHKEWLVIAEDGTQLMPEISPMRRDTACCIMNKNPGSSIKKVDPDVQIV